MSTLQTVPALASKYKAAQAAQIDYAIERVSARWRTLGPRFDAGWTVIAAATTAIVVESQAAMAERAADYAPAVMAQTGQAVINPTESLAPETFAGSNANGLPVEYVLASAPIQAKTAVRDGATARQAVVAGGEWLALATNSLLVISALSAEKASMGVSGATGYVRVVNGGACIRCIVLAGKFYRWNTGFDRHPRCRCEHVPANRSLAEGWVSDPYAYFNSLDDAAQIKLMGSKGSAQAVRDGGDIYQVANARRGRLKGGRFTSEGTTRQGFAGRTMPAGYKRLTPELIYDRSVTYGWSREKYVDELRKYGYVTDRGQVAGGAIRGRVEGFGQLGGGGARKAAREAIEEARRTGVRDPLNRYTMTAAERRVYDARRRWEVAQSGRSPYTSPGFGNTPDPYGLGLNRGGVGTRPITRAERDLAKKDWEFYRSAYPEIAAIQEAAVRLGTSGRTAAIRR